MTTNGYFITKGITADVRIGVRTRDLSASRHRNIRQLEATDVFVDHADVDEEPDDSMTASRTIH